MEVEVEVDVADKSKWEGSTACEAGHKGHANDFET